MRMLWLTGREGGESAGDCMPKRQNTAREIRQGLPGRTADPQQNFIPGPGSLTRCHNVSIFRPPEFASRMDVGPSGPVNSGGQGGPLFSALFFPAVFFDPMSGRWPPMQRANCIGHAATSSCIGQTATDKCRPPARLSRSVHVVARSLNCPFAELPIAELHIH